MEMQLTPNDVDTLALLPRLSLADLTADVDFHVVRPVSMFGHDVLVSELDTNHISYIDLGFDFACIPPEYLPWLDLFGTIITEIGTSRLDYMQFAKEIATCTGSFTHSLTTYSRRGEPDRVRPVLWLNLKCLPEYLEKALQLVAEVLTDVSFADRTRIREIVGREFAWAEHAVQSEGYSLAAARASAHLGLAGRYFEMFNGATAYLAVKKLTLGYARWRRPSSRPATDGTPAVQPRQSDLRRYRRRQGTRADRRPRPGSSPMPWPRRRSPALTSLP